MAPHTSPTLSDPAVVIARDRSLFVCWVEDIAGEARWVFVSQQRVRYTGPVFAKETTLTEIQELLDTWWEQTRRTPRGRVE